jgi:hypothetical protein
VKKLILGIATFACLSWPACAQSIGGKYTVEGKNLDGSSYSGTAEIVLTSETTCAINWQTGSSEAVGICMRNDESFAAAYVMDDVTGLIIYKVMPDGTLNGLWTISGSEGNGAEVLTPAR